MEKFVLVCVNEDLDVVDLSIYDDYESAYLQMGKEFNRERDAMAANGEDIVVEYIGKVLASLVWGEQPCEYCWHIVRKE